MAHQGRLLALVLLICSLCDAYAASVAVIGAGVGGAVATHHLARVLMDATADLQVDM